MFYGTNINDSDDVIAEISKLDTKLKSLDNVLSAVSTKITNINNTVNTLKTNMGGAGIRKGLYDGYGPIKNLRASYTPTNDTYTAKTLVKLNSIKGKGRLLKAYQSSSSSGTYAIPYVKIDGAFINSYSIIEWGRGNVVVNPILMYFNDSIELYFYSPYTHNTYTLTVEYQLEV